MTDLENYLNPPEAAKSERGGRLSDMTPKLRATMERLHREAKERKALEYVKNFDKMIDEIIGAKP